MSLKGVGVCWKYRVQNKIFKILEAIETLERNPGYAESGRSKKNCL
jgi:hypothetical protein